MQTLKPIANKVILVNLERGEKKTASGVIILDDSTTAAGERGVRARWAQVFEVGPEQKDVKRGDWVLMNHGRWSLHQEIDLGEGPFKIWLGDPDGMLAVSDEQPAGVNQEVVI